MSGIQSTGESLICLDDILMRFSLSGSYYVGFLILTFLLHVNNSISSYNYLFTAEKVNYWCADERFGNDSCASLSNFTDVCAEWVYDDPHSFVAEFQLACQEWKRTLVGSVHSFGYGAGLLLIGPLSDRYGRKSLIVITAAIGTLMGTAKSFTNNYWIFLVLEFMEAAFGDVLSPSFVLMVEMVANKKRVLTKVICSIGVIVGHGIITITAWLVSYWRHYLLILYAPTVLFLSYIYLLDESPRWLLTNGKQQRAVAILDKIAKRSQVELEKNIFDHLNNEKNEVITLKKSLKDTFASKVLLKRFFICIIWWTSGLFVSYGISVNSVLLPGNKYMNYGLLTVSEFPAKLLTLWILTKFRRKISLMSLFFIAAIICLAQPFTPSDLQWLSILLLIVAKSVAITIISTLYLFTSELFPTYTRNSMHALCSAIGRVGSTLAPQTPLLMMYWPGLPSLVFGVASLTAGLITLFTPNTANDVLPDTAQQAEATEHRKSIST